MKKKTLIFCSLAGIGIILIGAGIASASTKKPSTKPAENDKDEDEIEVIPPGPTGVPTEGGGKILVLPPKPVDTTGTEVKSETEQLIEVAERENKSPAQVVKEVVDQILPPGAQPLPATTAELSPALDPQGTVALAHKLLARESMDGWKDDMEHDIAEWQEKVGLRNDGQFGVVSVARMAADVGILPLVRAWTVGKHWDKASALADYKPRIEAVILDLKRALPDSEAHIMALQESMKREQAQALAKAPKAQPVFAAAQKILEKAAEMGEKKGIEAIS